MRLMHHLVLAVVLLVATSVHADDDQGTGVVVGPSQISLVCPGGNTYEELPPRPQTTHSVTVWLLVQPPIASLNDLSERTCFGSCPQAGALSDIIRCVETARCEGDTYYSYLGATNTSTVTLPQDIILNTLGLLGPASIVALHVYEDKDTAEVDGVVSLKTIDLIADPLGQVNILQGPQVTTTVGEELVLDALITVPDLCVDEIAELLFGILGGFISGETGTTTYSWTLLCFPIEDQTLTSAPTTVDGNKSATTFSPTLSPSKTPPISTSAPTKKATIPIIGPILGTLVPSLDFLPFAGSSPSSAPTTAAEDNILLGIDGAIFSGPLLRIPAGSLAGLFEGSTQASDTVSCDASVSVVLAGGTYGGSISTKVTITRARPVATIAQGDTHSIIEKLPFVISALPSCDPNSNSNCDLLQGNLDLSINWGQDALNYFWECFDVNGAECPAGLIYDKAELNFPINYLDAIKAPYSITLRVETQTLPVISSSIISADISVLANPTNVVCPRPDVLIASMPPRVNAHQDGISLRGSVLLVGTDILSEDMIYEWTVVDTESQPNELLPLSSIADSEADVADFIGFGTRPQLFLPSFLLNAGQSYRFRLSALTPCNLGTPELDPFAEISFQINTPPVIKKFAVAPLEGVAVATLFTLEALEFEDEDADYPLEFAFEYAYQGDDLSLEDRVPSSLSNYSPSPTLRTVLQVPPQGSGGKMKLYVFARDSLGAESARGSTKAETIITVTRPFPADITSEEEAFNVRDVIDETIRSGGSLAAVLRTMVAIASVCNEAGAIDPNENQILSNWNRGARDTMMNEAVRVRALLQQTGSLTPRLLAMETNFLKNVLAVPFEVSLSAQINATTIIKEIIASTQLELNKNNKGETSDSLLPADLVRDALQSIGLLAETARSVLAQISAEDNELPPLPVGGNETDSNTTRRLLGQGRYVYFVNDNIDDDEFDYEMERALQEGTESPKVSPELRDRTERQVQACALLSNLRTTVGELASVQLFGAMSGRVKDVLSAGGVRILVAREDTQGMGEESGVHTMDLNSNSSTGVSGLFHLPPNMMTSTTLDGRTPPEQVDIVAVQWAFDIRCDNDTNVFSDAYAIELPTSQEECAALLIAENSPISSISGVATLEFFDSTNATAERFSPHGMKDKIQIQVPVSEQVMLENEKYCGGGNSTNITCGYYDEEFGGGWTTEGCEVIEVNYEGLYVLCGCNHASDYAAWQSFVEDVDNTFTAPFSKPIATITTLAVLLLVIVFPCIAMLWLAMVIWARRKDAQQRDKVPRGALVLMVLNRTIMQNKQRRFFAIMKQRMVSDRDSTDKNDSTTAIDVKNDTPGRSSLKPSSKWQHIKRWWKAIRHEHSLLGLWRFDPHYTRVQRVCVFIGVLVGNLFGSALFFFLKNGDDITVGFLVLVVLATSLLVGAPVRFMVKVVFRSSANPVGSRMDIAAQIYRMGQGTSLDHTTVEDATLVLGYQQLYKAERRVQNAKEAVKAAAEFKRHQLRRTSSNASQVVELLMSAVLTPTRDNPPTEKDFEFTRQSMKRQEQEMASLKKPPTPADELDEANMDLEVAVKEVKRATRAAKEAWQKHGPIYGKRAAVKAQKSRFMKIAALVGEDDATLPRSRKPLMRPCWSKFAWGALIFMYALSTYYIVLFILTRNDDLATRLPDASEEEVAVAEQQVMEAWLTTSLTGVAIGYFVVEPLVQLLRFTVFPWMLLKCGSGQKELDGLKVLPQSRTDIRAKNSERTADFVFEFVAEAIESMF